MMDQHELALLLTTARILRATIRDMLPTANGKDDIADMDDALMPFESLGGDPVNEKEDRE